MAATTWAGIPARELNDRPVRLKLAHLARSIDHLGPAHRERSAVDEHDPCPVIRGHPQGMRVKPPFAAGGLHPGQRRAAPTNRARLIAPADVGSVRRPRRGRRPTGPIEIASARRMERH
jgi:hypothetical protein